MNQVRHYRKYPRTQVKQDTHDEEWTINLSAVAAAGILAFTFAKGMFWGYMLKKRFR
ncbi:MAG: hypothetical protein ACOYWZ_22245 [Bacillota bacterium]